MPQMSNGTIAALLSQAGAAHGVYEERELGGVYDQDWPRWYAAYLVEHGLNDLVGRPIAADDLAALLKRCDEVYRAEHPAEAWPDFYARRIVAERG